MSLSNPTPTNPAQHFLQWSGSRGALEWYDKDKKENVAVKIPFEFIVLDELSTITGYSDQDQSGFWSNEVRNIGREELTVRTKRGTRDVGLYRDLKGSPALTGMKYAKSVYIAHKIGEEWAIANIKMAGSALTAWIELHNSHAVDAGKIILSGITEGKKGTTTYAVPVFTWAKWEDSEFRQAFELDKQLQLYLGQYFTRKTEDEPADDNAIDDSETLATPEQINHFESLKAARKVDDHKTTAEAEAAAEAPATAPHQQTDDVIIEDITDEPINLDDIPF